MLYFMKVQMLDYESDSALGKSKNALLAFCKLLNLKVTPHEVWPDTFYIALPPDGYDLAEAMNAIDAFCYFRGFARRLSSEKTKMPMEDFLKLLSKEE